MPFDTDKYKVYTWKNWMMLHWIINPGLAFNELILGQRVPTLSLEDLNSPKTRGERIVIPCPNCQTMHDGRTWSTENGTAFKNWFGLYCPSCGGIIPCLTNLTSLLVLAITAPIWVWFYMPIKKNWLSKQAARYSKTGNQYPTNAFEGKGWIAQGLSFGMFMLVLNDLLFPLFSPKELSVKTLLVGLPIWLLAGLGFGYIMKLFMGKKGGNKI